MPSAVSLAWFWCWRGTQSKCQTKFASRESRCRPARHRGGSSQPSSHQHHHRHHHYNHAFNHRHRMGTNHQYQVSNGALGRCANNQNGNLRWHLPLGVDPPPLNGTNFQTFFYPTFFLLQLNPTYMKRILHLVSVKYKDKRQNVI